MIHRTLLILVPLFLTLLAPAADKPTAPPKDEKSKLEPADMHAIAKAIGATARPLGEKVWELSLPRNDLDVRTLDFGEIPAEAGLATTIRLWRCPCGKYYLLGDYVVTDFESNDVLDSLRQGNFHIASVSPILLREKPRILSIRFQAEGDVPLITKTLKEAQRWTGENRNKPHPVQ